VPHSKIYISVGHFCNFEKWKRATMFAAFPNIHLRDGQSTADRPTARLLQKYCFMEASTEHDGVASPDGERANPFTSRLARINSSSRLSVMTNTFARTIRARAQSTRGKRVHHASANSYWILNSLASVRNQHCNAVATDWVCTASWHPAKRRRGLPTTSTSLFRSTQPSTVNSRPW